MNQQTISLYITKVLKWPWEIIGQFVLIGLLSFLLACWSFQPALIFDEVHILFYTFLLLLMCLYRPAWSFFLLVALLPLETTNLLPPTFGLALRPYQLVTFVLALALLIQLLTKRITWPLFSLSRTDLGVAVLGFGSLLAVVGSLEPGMAFKATVILVSFMGLYAIFRYFLSQNILQGQALIAFGIGTGIVFLIALWQNIAFLHGYRAGMVMEGRPNSTFFEADWLGFFSALIVLLGIALVWYGFKQKYHRRHLSWFSGLVLILLLAWVVLILTVARSAWLATLVGMGVLFSGGVYYVSRDWWKRKLLLLTTATTMILGIVALVLVTVSGLTRFDIQDRLSSTATGEQVITVACNTPTQLPETISSVEVLPTYGCQHIRLEEKEILKNAGMSIQEVKRADPNFQTRSQIYQKTFSLIQAHWFLGIGGGNSALVLGTDERGAGLNASNLFLETWLSDGLVGLLALLFILGFISMGLIHETHLGSEKHLLGLGLLFTLIVFNLFNSGMLLGIFFGLLAYLATLREESGNTVKLETDFKIL